MMKNNKTPLSVKFAAAVVGTAVLVKGIGPGVSYLRDQGKIWFPDPAMYQGYMAIMPLIVLVVSTAGAIGAYKAFKHKMTPK